MNPRAYVFFDVDDTLVEWTIDWVDAFVAAAREVGVEVAPERALAALNAALSTFYQDYVREHAKAEDDREFWLAYDGRVLETLGVKQGLRQATEQVVETLTRPGTRRLFEEVPEVLQTLADSGFRLGIVTGRPRAEPDLEALGVRGYFHPVIDAFSARSSKSEGHMFHLAAKAAAEAGLPGWHVGDNYREDVLGARAAGLRPVLVDRKNGNGHRDCDCVGDLRELIDVLMEEQG